MILSQRLQAVAMLVTEGNRLADIGTDHAFVPIYLVEEGRIPSAIAMDVNRGPLERAKEHIAEHGLEGQIQVRLSDGLSALKEGEADTILIAGMGGALTVRILQQRKALNRVAGELVLQPQSEIAAVRRYLERSGWRIDREQMVLEDGKYYPMMRCSPGCMSLTDAQAKYGPCLMRERPAVWAEYLLWRKGILEKNLSSLQHAEGERGGMRRMEVKKELEELSGMIDNNHYEGAGE